MYYVRDYLFSPNGSWIFCCTSFSILLQWGVTQHGEPGVVKTVYEIVASCLMYKFKFMGSSPMSISLLIFVMIPKYFETHFATSRTRIKHFQSTEKALAFYLKSLTKQDEMALIINTNLITIKTCSFWNWSYWARISAQFYI